MPLKLKFFYLFWASVILQLSNLILLSTRSTIEEADRVTWVLVCTFVLQIPQILIIVFGTSLLLRNLSFVSLRDAWHMYLATVLGFSGVYFALYLCIDGAFESDDPYVFEGKPVELFVAMWYTSVAIQTLTGPGDISPIGALPELIVVVQMLAGMLYSVFIISHTQDLFHDHDEYDQQIYSSQRRTADTRTSRCWAFFTKNACVRRIRLFTRRYLIVVSLTIYTANLTMLRHLEPDVLANYNYRIGVVGMECVFQALQIGSVLSTSWKFVRHVDEITISFLLQAFVAVCLTFSGLYNLFFAFSPANDKCFSLVSYELGKTPFYQIIAQLFYYSVATMTSAGFGDVYPRKWYTRLLASTQMLISVLFTVVILGRGVSRLKDRRLLQRVRDNIYSKAGIPSPGGGPSSSRLRHDMDT